MDSQLAERKGWIFDMDGTLTVANHDFEAIRVALDLPAGQPILESLAQLPPSLAAPKWQQLNDIELEIAASTQPQPGAEALLKQLRSGGKRLGILTRNRKNIAQITLDAANLLHFFEPEAILSRDCCAPKPEPDGIHQLLQAWNLGPQEGVMVGDYVFDLLAGRNAGTATVHLDVAGEFAWPEHTDYSVKSLAQLAELGVPR
jgi:HAD superfamily hydrolase (TIGR01509 family)